LNIIGALYKEQNRVPKEGIGIDDMRISGIGGRVIKCFNIIKN
jgi:hypothetical protein